MRPQAAALALVLTALALCAAAAQAQGGARDAIAEAYRCIVKLHEAGGNVTALVERLNHAIDVAGENPGEAARIASEIVREYPRLVAEAVAERNRWYAALAAACCAAGVAGYLCYRYLPAAIWTLWLRMRRGDVVVVRRERAARKSMYASEEVRAVALAGAAAQRDLDIPRHARLQQDRDQHQDTRRAVDIQPDDRQVPVSPQVDSAVDQRDQPALNS